MTYDAMKEDFIRIKKEELEFINKAVITSNERKLTEYEILTICRRSNYYERKINDLLQKMQNDMYLEQKRLREEGKLKKDSVVLEFNVDNKFLSLVKSKYMLKTLLWIDPQTQKFRLPFRHGKYKTYPLNFLNEENRIEGIYLSCGIDDLSNDSMFIGNQYLCGIYYYLSYYNKIIPYYEVPIDKISEYEKNKTIVKNDSYVHPDEAKKIFDEEFLNENNKSIESIARNLENRLKHMNYIRSPEYKEKVLLDKIDELYEKVKGKFIQNEVLYNGKFLNILKEIYELPNGKTVEKEKVIKNIGKNSVIVIAITQDKEYIITFQNRIKDEKIAEFPSGYIENGENPIEAAKRELQEETGYISNDLFIVDKVFTSPGIDNSTTYIVVANNCIKTDEIKNNGTELVIYGLFSEVELKYLISNNIMNGAMNKLAYYNLVNNVEDYNVVYSNSNQKIYL